MKKIKVEDDKDDGHENNPVQIKKIVKNRALR
jgi:hypothetical protein